MQRFETLLEEATRKGSNGIPGAAVAVIDSKGDYIYKKVSGFSGVAEDAKPLDFDSIFFIASCTKLIASIAALQCVERGLIGLDDPLDNLLPELAQQPIIVPEDPELKSDTQPFTLRPAKNSITLRQLLTHSSGAAYDMMNPVLASWWRSQGRTPGLAPTGDILEEYLMPRLFEAGESWTYGTGLDWAGLLIGRLNKSTLGKFVEENIFKPLEIKSTTWHLLDRLDLAERLMAMSTRSSDGTLKPVTAPIFPTDPVNESGGAGLVSSIDDYKRVLADLLKDHPITLQKETADLLFAPQFPEGSAPLKSLYANGKGAIDSMVGMPESLEGLKINHGLGGLIVLEDIQTNDYYKPKGTLSWMGLPNLLWSINREKRRALFFGTQVLPWGDEKAQKLTRDFETGVWRECDGR
ncbi:beta-lactamase/transpeptidase-like protein [Delitschia confertaspora ATCC 74209]|uniref:Beta-lactamase/transpeptidase-like protein n=1 Tax=Delitschia confertaspora ATCC 74209 TaxID=1513339 RepID=A0A9P4MTT7_9PLEO|nr:beta-lactamase/transpeptidase-like protein [Delitschia confertaspora ATCC 74209]